MNSKAKDLQSVATARGRPRTKNGGSVWSKIASVTLRTFPPISRVKLVVRETKLFVHLIGPAIRKLSHKGDRHAQNRILQRPVEGRRVPHQSTDFFSNQIQMVKVGFHGQRNKIRRTN